MSLDMMFLHRYITDDDPNALSKVCITPEMLFDDGRKLLEFSQSFYVSHGKLPDLSTLEIQLGKKISISAPEPLSFYAEKITQRYLANILNPSIGSAIEALKAQDPIKAMEELSNGISKANEVRVSEDPTARLVDLRESTQERWDEYQRVKAMGDEIDGIPLPWPTMNKITRGLHGGELWFIIARLKTGKCISVNSLVPSTYRKQGSSGFTSRLSTAREVMDNRGTAVTFSQDSGDLSTVFPQEYWENGVKACVRVTTRLGNVLIATPDHKLLTPDGWVEAIKIAPGTKLASPAILPEPEHTKASEWHKIAMAALLLADGSVTKEVLYSKRDPRMQEIFKKATEAFGCLYVPRRPEYGDYICRGASRENNPARAWLEEIELFGKKSIDKTIPDFVFSLPNDQLRIFLGLLWSGDGCIEKGNSGTISYSSASERMVDEVRHLCLRLGIVTRKRGKQNSAVKGEKKFDSFEIVVRGVSKDRFVEVIGPHLEGKRKDQLSHLVGSRKVNDNAIRQTPKIKECVLTCLKNTGRLWYDFWVAYGWDIKDPSHSPGIRGLGIKGDGCLIPRSRLRGFARWCAAHSQPSTELEYLNWVCSEDIYWDELVSVEDAGLHETVDLTIEGTQNYVASGLIVHNTWLQVVAAAHFWSTGHSVLMVSMEMPILKLSRRLDAARMKLPYGEFVSGALSTDQEMEYAKGLQEFKDPDRPPFWMVGRGRVETTLDIEMLIEELKPDVCLIDGMYFLTTPETKGAGKYERVSSVVDDLQRIAQRKLVPIVATSQFNRSVGKNKLKTGSESIGFAYEIAQNADVIISMTQDEDMKAAGKMLVSLMEHREGEDLSLLLNWSFEHMNMGEEIGVVHGEDLEKDDEDERIVF